MTKLSSLFALFISICVVVPDARGEAEELGPIDLVVIGGGLSTCVWEPAVDTVTECLEYVRSVPVNPAASY